MRGGEGKEMHCHVGVPTSLPSPRGEESLGGESSGEAYCGPGACSPWRLSWCDWFCWSAVGLGWWAAGVVLSPLQNVSGFYSVSRHSDLPAAHVNFKYFVHASDYFVRAAVGWLQGSAYGVLPQEYVGRVPEVLVDEWDRGYVGCCWG
jgi:hypothetical protein